METKWVVRLCCLSMNVIRETLIFFHHFGRTEPRWWCVNSYDSYKSSINEYSLRKPWKRYASFVSMATIQTSQLRTLLKRVVENRTWKKFQFRTGFEPMTSAIPMQRSTSWANKPTGSWQMCWVQINHPSNELYLDGLFGWTLLGWSIWTQHIYQLPVGK